jgi:hypothetical protein
MPLARTSLSSWFHPIGARLRISGSLVIPSNHKTPPPLLADVKFRDGGSFVQRKLGSLEGLGGVG